MRGFGRHLTLALAALVLLFHYGTASAQPGAIFPNNAFLQGSALGASPTLNVIGLDANLGLTLLPKGTGGITIGTVGGGGLTITQGAITADLPALSFTQTWNNPAVTFQGIFGNVAATFYAGPSLLVELQINGTDVFAINPGGGVVVTPNGNIAPLTLTGGSISLSSPVAFTQTWNAAGVVFTGFDENITNTASAAGSLLHNWRLGGTSQVSFDKLGNVNVATNAGTVRLGAANDMILGRQGAANLHLGAADAAAPVAQALSVQSVVAGTVDTAGTSFTLNGSQGTGTGAGGSVIVDVAYPALTGNTQNTLIPVVTLLGANKQAAGVADLVSVTPIVNQSGTAGYNGLAVDVTRTAVGSGVGQLVALRVGGVQRFGVTDGAAGIGTQIKFAQATVPTCSANCGAAPTVTGSDSSMLVTLGAGPANAFTITFNGTWASQPSCSVQQQTTAANYVTKAATSPTTIVVSTAAGPSASDVFSVKCSL